MTEAILQKLILGQLHQLDRDHFGAGMVDGSWRARRIRVWRANTGVAQRLDERGKPYFVRFGKKGQCDVTGIITLDSGVGQRFECENKAPGGTRSPEQIAFGDEMIAAGAIYVVAYSVEDALAPVRAALGIGETG